MTYDEAIQKAETLVVQLEQTQALSVTEYQTKATEIRQLLDFCESQLREMDFGKA